MMQTLTQEDINNLEVVFGLAIQGIASNGGPTMKAQIANTINLELKVLAMLPKAPVAEDVAEPDNPTPPEP